ncbi:MAG TPA: hypothetical protein VHT05_02195 [Candidatus Elarobacter sp.]|nr:hypothetical protein [Candidatus Elarobacter sp.]
MRQLFGLIAATLAVPLLGVAEPDTRPACVRTDVVMTTTVDTAHALSGDSFGFKTVDPARAPDGTAIPPGTPGYGVVAISQHAQRGGRGGYVVIEARFLLLPNEHVPVTIDWTTAARATATGSSRNIPGIAGAIPFVGYVLGPYGFIHHGKDIAIEPGTKIPVLIGDDVALATCRIVPPTPTPSPTPTPTPTPAPATSPSPSASPVTGR